MHRDEEATMSTLSARRVVVDNLINEHRSAVEGSVGDVIELAFWESVHDTDNPRLFAAYLEKYPGGEFAAVALVRLEALRAGEGKRN